MAGRLVRTVSQKAVADAFAEWLRRYNEEPDRFKEEYPDDESDYGDGCATYLFKLLDEEQDAEDSYEEVPE